MQHKHTFLWVVVIFIFLVVAFFPFYLATHTTAHLSNISQYFTFTYYAKVGVLTITSHLPSAWTYHITGLNDNITVLSNSKVITDSSNVPAIKLLFTLHSSYGTVLHWTYIYQIQPVNIWGGLLYAN